MMGLTRWANAREPRRPSATRRLKQREQAFQQQVIAAAKLQGFAVWHDYDSRRNTAGWPDLILLKPGRPVLAVELKSETGTPSKAQEEWLALFAACGAETAIWHPADWPRVLEVLAR